MLDDTHVVTLAGTVYVAVAGDLTGVMEVVARGRERLGWCVAIPAQTAAI